MKLDVAAAEIQLLLEAPSPATITVYREDGEAITSPVWFRVNDDAFEVVVAARDRKLALLQHVPRAIVLIFEASVPFRGVQARGRVSIEPDDRARTRLAIASRSSEPRQGVPTPTSTVVRRGSWFGCRSARPMHGTWPTSCPER